MHELLFFMIGLLLGGIVGVFTMCLLQISRDSSNSNRKDDNE